MGPLLSDMNFQVLGKKNRYLCVDPDFPARGGDLIRRISILLFTLIITLSLVSLAHAAPQVVLNSQVLNFQDTQPTIENGRTLVPLRAIFDALGAQVQWDGDTQTVTATRAGTEIRLIIGGQAYKNGLPVALDVPAKIIDDRAMVPLRFIGEALGCQVNWDGNTQIINITDEPGTGTGRIEVHFIDVGQADAIYISLPDHSDILIDGGNVADGQTVVDYLRGRSVDDIELLIATHPHEDHIGGLPVVLDIFKVKRIIDSGATAGSGIYKEYSAKAAAEGALWEPDNYQTLVFGNTALQILTGPETWKDTNDYSVVCRLDTGDIEFLFTGDAGGPAEAALAGQLDAEILKVGHHGSRTSTSAGFLSKVKPEIAIISVGAGNSYGHPAPETLQRLESAGVTIYRTDTNGNLMVFVDGNTYSIGGSPQGPLDMPEPQAPPQLQPQVQPAPEAARISETDGQYVGSSKSNKYHYPSCRYAKQITPGNLIWFNGEIEAQRSGYVPCKVCRPPQ